MGVIGPLALSSLAAGVAYQSLTSGYMVLRSPPFGSMFGLRRSDATRRCDLNAISREGDDDVALIRRCRAGDMDAEGLLVKRHQPLVRSIARRYWGRAVDREDLIQCGSIGLVKAIRKFDPSKGVKLASYAKHWIKREILAEVRRSLGIGKVPARLAWLVCRVYREGIDWRRLDIEGVAEELGVSIPLAADVRSVLLLRECGSLREENSPAVDCRDPGAEDADTALTLAAQRLVGLDLEIVRMRIMVGAETPEICRALGISKMTVSRRQRKAAADLRLLIDAA